MHSTTPDSPPPVPSSPGTWTVLYDGECDFCRRMVDRLRDMDAGGRLSLQAYQSSEARAAFSWIPEQALAQALHLVSPAGEVWTGAAAVERILYLLPGTALPRLLFRLPLGRWLARHLYRLVARNRTRLGCGTHCPR